MILSRRKHERQDRVRVYVDYEEARQNRRTLLQVTTLTSRKSQMLVRRLSLLQIKEGETMSNKILTPSEFAKSFEEWSKYIYLFDFANKAYSACYAEMEYITAKWNVAQKRIAELESENGQLKKTMLWAALVIMQRGDQ